MTHDQKEWAKSQDWYVTSAKTLSGNWIVYVQPKAGETPDLELMVGTPVMQYADYPMLLAWAGF